MRKNYLRRFLVLSTVILILFLFIGCGPKEHFIILSGSENETLEPIIQEFARKNNVDIEMEYKGSVDIMLELGNPDITYDAVWPANSLWISLGNTNHLVKHEQSIMTSPVVFGIRRSLAEQLGFVGREVSVKEILQAIQQKKLKFMMTSATQSNSGASAYIGFLYALLDNPDIIYREDLYRSELQSQIRELLAGIHRSSGSSGWLKDLFLKGDYDAMINYEAMMIEANKELIRQGKETLYIIYPFDGLVMADSPLGYVNRGEKKKEEIFLKLQEYLLSQKVQDKILAQGRRTGFASSSKGDKAVFNPEWGIDTERILSPIRLPSGEVIQEALYLYQTQFKKPSYTIFCLDFSGSMSGEGERQLKEAMRVLFDQEIARKYMLQFGQDDRIVVIPFSDHLYGAWEVQGNNQQDLQNLYQQINNLSPQGNTDIYNPVIAGLAKMKQTGTEQFIPAIILMTDGQSNTGQNFTSLANYWEMMGKDIPVFSILFGKASESQLEEIAEQTRARVFDGKTDLINAFKKARGYN